MITINRPERAFGYINLHQRMNNFKRNLKLSLTSYIGCIHIDLNDHVPILG